MRDRTIVDEFLTELEEENEWLRTEISNLKIERNKLITELESIKEDYLKLKRKLNGKV